LQLRSTWPPRPGWPLPESPPHLATTTPARRDTGYVADAVDDVVVDQGGLGEPGPAVHDSMPHTEDAAALVRRQGRNQVLDNASL
jgi:hypothetical protein